jgi:hypothetical protein
LGTVAVVGALLVVPDASAGGTTQQPAAQPPPRVSAAARAARRRFSAQTVHAVDVLGTASVTDATGDDLTGGPNGDITSARVDYRTDRITATIKTAGMANPRTDSGFTDGTGSVDVQLSPDGGQTVDFVTGGDLPAFDGFPPLMLGEVFRFSGSDFEPLDCDVNFGFSAVNGYTLSVASSCLNDPPVPLEAVASFEYGDGEDFAPDADAAPLGPIDPQPALPYWPGWDIARGLARVSSQQGYVLDAFGGLHAYSGLGVPTPVAADVGGARWGFKIARGVAMMPDLESGYVLDGYGGLHPFALHGHTPPPAARLGAYWRGWDIARGVSVDPDGKGGYVIDGYGGLHAFGVGANPRPGPATGAPYWRGWNIARGVTIRSGGGGYVLDGYGGLHAFTVNGVRAPAAVGAPYWRGWDIARGVDDQLPGGQGAIVDGYGGVHNFTG